MSSKIFWIAVVAVWVLTACGGGSDHNPNATPTPTTSTITVSGRVVNNWKNPIAAMPVVVSGKPPLVTDGNGRFSVSDVTPPYDVSVVHIGSKTATIYKGLTRTDPVLVGTSDAVTAQTANLSGSMSGVSLPQPALHNTLVVVMAPDSGYGSNFASAAGAYAFPSFRWYGSPNTTGAIYALQVRYSATGAPAEYKAYGKRENVALANGGTFAGQNVRLNPIPNGNVSGSVSMAAGYTLTGKGIFLQLSPDYSMALETDYTSALTFSYVTPNIGPPALTLYASARKAGGVGATVYRRGVPATAAGIAMNIPAGPELSLPADGANGVATTTQFNWSAFAGGVHAAEFYSDAPNKPTYIIYTAGISTTIPDLSAVGLGLPSSTPYKWAVLGLAPINNVDQLAVDAGFWGLFATVPGDSSLVSSTERTFNTGP